MHRPQRLHHACGPVEVLLAPLGVPTLRGVGQDVAEVADLVGQFDEPGLGREGGRVVDLRLLALGLEQGLVVGHFQHHGSDLGAEQGLQFLGGGFGVLQDVVQHGGAEHHGVVHAAQLRQHLGQCNGVVDVGRGLGVLAALVAVLLGREGHGLDEQREGVGGLHRRLRESLLGVRVECQGAAAGGCKPLAQRVKGRLR